MYKIAFINIKGGVGKSTTSFNVAGGIAQKGKKVLIVDLDPQSSTTSMFVRETPTLTIADLMNGGHSTKDALIQLQDRLFLLPSSLQLANVEIKIRQDAMRPQHDILSKILKQVESDFDYCIIDCGPVINLLTVNSIYACNRLVVPIKPDKFALQGFEITANSINQVRDNFELDVDYKVLFTIVNRNNEEKKIIKAIRNLVGSHALSTQIRNQPKPIVVASSLNQLVINDTDAAVARDLWMLIDEILEEVGDVC